MPADEVDIARFLADEGLSGPLAPIGRGILEAAGLTNPRKSALSSAKLDRARAALESALARACDRPECQGLLKGDGRRLVQVPRASCEVCGGSNNQGAVRRMIVACTQAEVHRLLVVGGTPRQWDTLHALITAEAVELRTVDGTAATNEQQALRNCAWADLVVVWAPTPLGHRVSDLYAADRCVADHVTAHRRGIEGLAEAVVRHLSAG